MNVLAHIRTIEVAVQRMEADETRIQELERRKQVTADEVLAATKDLVLALAAQKGLLGLAPTEIVAVFEGMELPKAAEAEAARPGLKRGAAGVMQIGADELADVTVEYTSHKRGHRVVLVQGLGLKRGGPNTFWSGRVDREGLARLIGAFPNKVKINAVHPQSKPVTAEAPKQPETVSKLSIEERGSDNMDTVAAEAQEDLKTITTSMSWPRPFPTLPRRVASGVLGDDEAT